MDLAGLLFASEAWAGLYQWPEVSDTDPGPRKQNGIPHGRGGFTQECLHMFCLGVLCITEHIESGQGLFCFI
jgi:hypothetical protein